jgi:hypothetical protein
MLLQQIIRLIKTPFYAIQARYEKFNLEWKQAICPHVLRPASIKGSPGQFCAACLKTQKLTLEDFLELYGEDALKRIFKFDFPPASGQTEQKTNV